MPICALVSGNHEDFRRQVSELLGADWQVVDCYTDREQLVRLGAAVEIVYGNVREHELPALANLRWVQASWAGVENLLYPAMVASEVVITNVRGAHARVMSEHALAGLLHFARDLAWFTSGAREWRPKGNDPVQLAGSRCLVLGAGAIARQLIPRLRALELQVTAVTRDGRAVDGADHCGRLDEVTELAEASDHAVCLLPATAATVGRLDRAFFRALGGVFINLSRGAVVVEADLLAAVQAGELRGAMLDVTDPEPPPADSPLWDHPRVLVTGHNSYKGGFDPGQHPREVFLRNLSAWLVDETGGLQYRVDKDAGY